MVKKTHELSLVRQCRLLSLHRSAHYYTPVKATDDELILMRWIDEIHIIRPFLGARRITDELSSAGCRVNKKRIGRLMKKMGVQAIYPKPNTSKMNPQNKIYPYLLRGVDVSKPNQAWATDITYIPMERGFVYLTVIMDWCSRKILSWRLSNTLDSQFCIDALENALFLFGKPEIFNSDQGSQYTSEKFTSVLKANDIRISMDGKGAWRDNVFVERLWRSVKYEEIYLKAYDDIRSARKSLGMYFDFYNMERRHQSLDRQTPDQVYYENVIRKAA